MGLFDKLKKSVELGAKALGDLAETGAKALNELAESAGAKESNDVYDFAPSQPQRPAAAASGDSWGDEMPAEENQYNFSGNYVQYFEKVLREEFPAYALGIDDSDRTRRTVFTLRTGTSKALVIEVMTESSAAQKLRRQCEAEGTPYLRFYFDHRGWWNTRSYVARRVRAALR